jgi:hypothetical protein
MLFLRVIAPSHSVAGGYQNLGENEVSLFGIEWLPTQQTAA